MKWWNISDAPTEAQIGEISDLLHSGAVVLLPTDTIYGLHAVANDERAVLRIAQIKGREVGKRFVMIAADIPQLESLGIEVPAILHEIWPSPLTAVLRRGESTIAARVPESKWLCALLERTGPLISTSANRTGEPHVSSPRELPPSLMNEIDGVVDAGRREGKASTIVDFTGIEPRFIREGDSGFTQALRKTLMKKL